MLPHAILRPWARLATVCVMTLTLATTRSSPASAESFCQAPSTGGDTLLRRIVDAVNDGGYPTIQRLVTTLANVDGVSGPIRRKAIAVMATKSYFGHPLIP